MAPIAAVVRVEYAPGVTISNEGVSCLPATTARPSLKILNGETLEKQMAPRWSFLDSVLAWLKLVNLRKKKKPGETCDGTR